MSISGAAVQSTETGPCENTLDDQRLTESVSACYPALLAYLVRRTGDRMLAEDLAQEAVVILLERLEREPLDDPSALAGYLRRTAINLHICGIRERARRKTDCRDRLPEVLCHESPFSDRVAQERQRELVARISQLPTGRDRELLRLYLLEQRGKPAICAALGVAEGHFKRVLSRAKQRLLATPRPGSCVAAWSCPPAGSQAPTDSCRSAPLPPRRRAAA